MFRHLEEKSDTREKKIMKRDFISRETIASFLPWMNLSFIGAVLERLNALAVDGLCYTVESVKSYPDATVFASLKVTGADPAAHRGLST